MADLDGLPPQDEEGLGSLRQETGELVDKDMLNLVGLLDLDGHADGVYTGFDEDPLVLVSGNGQGRQENLRGRLGFNLGHVVSLGCLGGEIGQRQRRCQAAPDCLEVGAE